jgi:hypothetical protein
MSRKKEELREQERTDVKSQGKKRFFRISGAIILVSSVFINIYFTPMAVILGALGLILLSISILIEV